MLISMCALSKDACMLLLESSPSPPPLQEYTYIAITTHVVSLAQYKKK